MDTTGEDDANTEDAEGNVHCVGKEGNSLEVRFTIFVDLSDVAVCTFDIVEIVEKYSCVE